MIENLIHLYDDLDAKHKIPQYGLIPQNVLYGLDIDDSGKILNIRKLGDWSQKRPVHMVSVPARVTRSSGVKANFLCDTPQYLLADDTNARNGREKKAFKAAAELHLRLLSGIDDSTAKAICAFFARSPQVSEAKNLLTADEWKHASTANFVFYHNDRCVMEDERIVHAWLEDFSESGTDGEVLESIVDGSEVQPAAIHPKIKGVWGAQSSGGALISFNKESFNSYGKSQNANAPMSEEQAYKYTAALNYLLADNDHVAHVGDTTIVYWAESGSVEYQDFFSMASDFGGGSSSDGDLEANLGTAINALAAGRVFDVGNFQLNPDEHFYVLGLSPNSARISVRFFLKDTFGAFLQNIVKHYSDLSIQRPIFDKNPRMPLWRLLNQTTNQAIKADVPSVLVGGVLRSVLLGVPYPASLLSNVELRIRSEKDINADKAAIIKAYYLRQPNSECPKEVLQMSINEESENVPYVLGRMFSLYEQIQQAANPGINTTIKDKYFNSASTTPSLIFPILGNLAEKHLRKLGRSEPGRKVNLSKALQRLSLRLGDQYPARLSLPQQGAFQLGYYFETQKHYENKTVKQENSNKQGENNE
ncbi:type I-C CRISPR-associated protein Cas8c/Csd1 [Bifidobacterium sp. ESL0704]|uniref:type I-C CRISPR-associated protein Cas8c/Csd1 n=1 Tax=Bifidobacterium sp. ESL0704 TaxID=2983219 RepID=UPI0023F89575|nr:type I-C CRISPR-associated protein Cas8c/Csd1 [Bifidobacterium sp. ESL0704]WEV53573.1 type I-C CRISPR-associated protein Cas8c/Csd1 [Bifidobacterium sp. ESL0704]